MLKCNNVFIMALFLCVYKINMCKMNQQWICVTHSQSLSGKVHWNEFCIVFTSRNVKGIRFIFFIVIIYCKCNVLVSCHFLNQEKVEIFDFCMQLLCCHEMTNEINFSVATNNLKCQQNNTQILHKIKICIKKFSLAQFSKS